MTRLIIDTDTAGDDVFSLLIALLHPRARLEAVTVCCGNVRFEQEVENALYAIEMAGRSGEVPVYPGCREPLIARVGGSGVRPRQRRDGRLASSRARSSAPRRSTRSTSSSVASTRARAS